VHIQEQEIEAASKKLEQLRQLVAEGLIARNELTAAEDELVTAKGKLESNYISRNSQSRQTKNANFFL